MTMVQNSSATIFNFYSIMLALNLQTSVGILQHLTPSLNLPTRSLAKFFTLSFSCITLLTQYKLITFLMRPSLQVCMLFIAHLNTSLGNFSPGALVFQRHMFLNSPLITDIVMLTRQHQAQIDSRLSARLFTTMPSVTKFITAILTATSWKQFNLVPMKSFVSIPTIQLP